MSDQQQLAAPREPDRPCVESAVALASRRLARAQVRNVAVITAVLVCAFAKPLSDIFRFAIHSDLFSHVLLIPFISGYLVWLEKNSLPTPSRPAKSLAVLPWAVAMVFLAIAWSVPHSGAAALRSGYLTWVALSFLFCFLAVCFLCVGVATLRAIAFPLAFLFFAVPFPGILVDWIESFLQYSSAFAAHVFFTVTGMSFLRDGLFFKLPGIRLEVAPECSGIHSTLVLFITSLVAGQLFLRKPLNRWLIALAVIPLGILRNAFRIWTIGELCVHVSPDMINSPIHHRGGPLFFAVSLLPLFLLLYYLRRSESKANPAVKPQ